MTAQLFPRRWTVMFHAIAQFSPCFWYHIKAEWSQKEKLLFDQRYPAGYFDIEITGLFFVFFFYILPQSGSSSFWFHVLVLPSVAKLRYLLCNIHLILFNKLQLLCQWLWWDSRSIIVEIWSFSIQSIVLLPFEWVFSAKCSYLFNRWPWLRYLWQDFLGTHSPEFLLEVTSFRFQLHPSIFFLQALRCCFLHFIILSWWW